MKSESSSLHSRYLGLAARLFKPKFRETHRLNAHPRSILDIGVANNSYLECKAVFPNAVYCGVDFQMPTIQFAAQDRFLLCNLESEPIALRPNEKFDLIIANHVLEHLSRGHQVFEDLCMMLNPEGLLYAEFPSVRTIMSRKHWGRYHFHDDPTHKQLYQLEDLANSAFAHNCKVLSCGPVSTPAKSLAAPFRSVIGALTGHGWQPFMLHALGKIDHILVRASR
jgi:Methyltransferase domain